MRGERERKQGANGRAGWATPQHEEEPSARHEPQTRHQRKRRGGGEEGARQAQGEEERGRGAKRKRERADKRETNHPTRSRPLEANKEPGLKPARKTLPPTPYQKNR